MAGNSVTSRSEVKTRVSCDAAGRVVGFSYHDGQFEGVVLNADEQEARLFLRSSGGERRTIVLERVLKLHVDGFREGNIVSVMRVLEAASVDEELRVALIRKFDLSGGDLLEGLVFSLDASFGGDVLSLCGDVEVIDG